MRNLLFLASLVLVASACGSSESEEARSFCKAVAAAREAQDAAAVEAARATAASLKPTSSVVQRGQRSLTEWLELSKKAAELGAKLDKATDEERTSVESELAKMAPKIDALQHEFMDDVKTLAGKTGVEECKKVK